MIKVFLSHNSSDKPLASDLAKRLQMEGDIELWFDQWNLLPGDSLQREIEKALDQCQVFLLLIGKGGFGSWQEPEMRIAITRHVNNKGKDFRVIPVFLPGTSARDREKLPGFLFDSISISFYESFAEEDNYRSLLRGIYQTQPESSTKIKPIGGIEPSLDVNLQTKAIRAITSITEIFSNTFIYPDECDECLESLNEIETHCIEFLDDDWPALFRAKSHLEKIRPQIKTYRLICQEGNEISKSSRSTILESLNRLKEDLK